MKAKIASVNSALLELSNEKNNLESLNNELKKQLTDKELEKQSVLKSKQESIRHIQRLETVNALLKPVSRADYTAMLNDLTSNREKSKDEIIGDLVATLVCREEERKQLIDFVDQMSSMSSNMAVLKAQLIESMKKMNSGLSLVENIPREFKVSRSSEGDEPIIKRRQTISLESANNCCISPISPRPSDITLNGGCRQDFGIGSRAQQTERSYKIAQDVSTHVSKKRAYNA